MMVKTVEQYAQEQDDKTFVEMIAPFGDVLRNAETFLAHWGGWED